MSLGTILVSLAVVLGVGAYVAWPFRRAGDTVADGADVERLVEAWVRRAQAAQVAQVAVVGEGSGELQGGIARASKPGHAEELTPVVSASSSGDDATVNFCPYCGRRVEQDHVFCPKCGKQLSKGKVR